MKKIFFIFHDTNMTGASISLLRIIKSSVIQKKYDIHVFLAAEEGAIIDQLTPLGIKIYAFNKRSEKGVLSKLWTRIIYYYQLISKLFMIRPDVVYLNTLLNFGEIITAKMMGMYTLVHSHEGAKIIQKYSRLIKLADYFTSEYIVVSEYAKTSLEQFVNQKRKKNIVYNGVSIPTKQISSFAPNEVVRLSIIATIDRNKAQLTAIKAFEYLLLNTQYKVYLNIFGKKADNQYYLELVNYIDTKNLTDYICFHGEVIEQNTIYDATDIVIITSEDETFSLTALEGFIACKPVIAPKIGGLPEVIEDHISGLLFKVGDHDELANNIIKIIDDHALRLDIIEKAYQKAQNFFDINLTVEKIDRLLSNVVLERNCTK